MSEASITIEFSRPRKCSHVKGSYLITGDGQPDLFLPRSKTLLKELESGLIESATVPEYIANDSERDWGDIVPRDDDDSFLKENDDDGMSRHDWFMLGVTMAMLIRGENLRDAAWEAGKVVDKLEQDRYTA